ncbi:hypothetical protein ABPG72_022270 [Tetrahymena utriculariae]
MKEIFEIQFQKELQIHSSVLTVIHSQITDLVSCHEDLNECVENIQIYTQKFLDMKKLARKEFNDTNNHENLKIEDKGEKSQIIYSPKQQSQTKESRQHNQHRQIILKSKSDYQMKLCLDLLNFIHKNILAQILASLVAIEKIKGQKDFKDKFNSDVINIQVQCSRLMILTDYLDKWIQIDADKDCIVNPNLNEQVMRAVKKEDISSNLGSDIQEQYSQFLNVIYSTYALIYESGLKQNSNKNEQSKINKTNGNIEKQLGQPNDLNEVNQNPQDMKQEQTKQEKQQLELSQNKKEEIQQQKQEIDQQNKQNEGNNENSQANQNSVGQDRSNQKIQLGRFELMYKSMKFLIKKEQAKIMTEKLQINPTTEQIILAWRMYEIVPEVKTMFYLQLERINYCNKFYFPRLAKRIDLRYLLQNTSKYFVFPSILPEKEKANIQEKIQQCFNQTKYVPQFHHFLHQKQQQYQQQLSTTDFIASVLYNRSSLLYHPNYNQGRATYNSQGNSFLFSQQRNQTEELFNINQKDPLNKVKVRIMSSIQLENSFDVRQGSDDTFFNKLSNIMCISRDKTPGYQFNGGSSQNQNGGASGNLNDHGQMLPKKKINLILHIHGGGFVAMNTFSHQIYTRKWANQVDDSVIISVDYRKAPEHRYPAAIDDVWQVYNFIMNYFEDIFTNIQIHTITLAGDSAGGNLCMSLMNLIIQEELYRKPTGILLSYPALNLNGNVYTPSSLHSMLDAVLPSSFLKICLESYLPNTPEYLTETFVKYDSLLSPILIQDSILQQFPPINIFCGEEDPLFDDSLRLFHRTRMLKDPMYIQIIEQYEEKKKQNESNINNSKNNSQSNQGSFGEEHFIECQNEILQNQSHVSTMTVYPRLKHGYLNLDFPFGVPLVRKCVQQSIDSLKELIQQSQNNLNVQNPRSSTLRSQLIRSSYQKSNNNNSSSTPSKQIQTCPDQQTY